MRTVSPSLIDRVRALPAARRTLLVIFALCSVFLILSWVSRPAIHKDVRIMPAIAPSEPVPTDANLTAQWERIKQANKVMAPAPQMVAGGTVDSVSEPSAYPTPMIAHAAELAVTTKEFSHSRSTLEEILERHHGYAAKLRMVGQPAGSLLTATLRVPSSEFNAAVVDLKTLGNVEREEQTADEITQQRADLEARLTNAQGTLARLQGILAKNEYGRTVVEVQRQVANVSAEIARLEAERAASEHRVIFAQVLFSLREEVAPPAQSLAAEFKNAATVGLGDALSSLSAIALYVISRGPVTLLWVLLVFFPARWIWRKWHPVVEQARGIPQGA
jgi:hypothetical protein